MTGLFITLEGGDGVGKTTQAQLLTAWLEGLGRTVVRTREPGGTPLGAQLRELLLHGTDPVDPRAEALLYAADRAQHVSALVRPALERGEVVLQDRYLDSSVAYQGAGRVLGAAEVRDLSLWATGALLPQLTVLLDLDPALAAERRGARDGAPGDRLESEKLDFHERVRAEFLALAAAEPDRFLVLDATAPIDQVHAAIRARITPLL